MIKKLYHILKRIAGAGKPLDKQASEAKFWNDELIRYQQWYDGQIAEMYATPAPQPAQKIILPNPLHSAILTWHKLHQEAKYLYDLKLNSLAFEGKRVIDIGSGPMPSATCFKNIELYCLDPLLEKYFKAGFPVDLYRNVKFLQAHSEHIPTDDNFFDVVLSVNALDHVDDFEVTAAELKRILKPDGVLVFHVHYHPPSQNEPLQLSDAIMVAAFKEIPNFRKISESKEKFGYRCDPHESYAVWSNSELYPSAS